VGIIGTAVFWGVGVKVALAVAEGEGGTGVSEGAGEDVSDGAVVGVRVKVAGGDGRGAAVSDGDPLAAALSGV
jgi:hypothetical protein